MKILFFTGKGGVGKSTLAAAAAWQLSQKHRVLIVSLDPAHNLGDIFGVTLKKKTFLTERLALQEIDLQKRAKAYLKSEINVLTDTYKYLQVLNLDKYFSVLQYSPGIEEYALLNSIEEIIASGNEYDYVIFDTPPTGLTLRFLALPSVTVTWIDRLTQIRKTILEKCHTIHRIRGPLSNEETVLDYDEKTDKVMRRLDELRRKYEELNAILRGADCGIVVVFNPDVLSLRESERLIEALANLRLPLRLLIHNKIADPQQPSVGPVEERIRRMTDAALKQVRLSGALLDGNDNKLYRIQEDITGWF